MEELVRVRLEFEDHRRMLSKPQRRDGLRRSWLLLPPGLATVADLATHLSRRFLLQNSCPRGLVLSMDGFVLPSFESTCIFKDKDIIRVRKRKGKLKFLKNDDNEHHIRNLESAMQPAIQGDRLLEIKKFEENLAEYYAKDGGEAAILLEDAIVVQTPLTDDRKRKKGQPKKLQSKRRKKDQASPEELYLDQNQSSSKGGSSRKSILNKNKTPNEEGRSDAQTISQTGASSRRASGSRAEEDSHDKCAENSQKNKRDLKVDGCTKKSPSRTARRKKERRQWLREIRKSEINQLQLPANNMHMSPGHPLSDTATVVQDKIVPVVIQSGHIFSETTELPDQQKKTETLQCNGTTRKEGQNCVREDILCKGSVGNGRNGGSNEKMNPEKRELLDNHIKFENLYPLIRLPKEGDVIVYRIFESSSPWGSELSTFRVGKVTAYDPLSMNIVLMPVPEHPIFSSMEGEPLLHPNISRYKEDGSLEIEYPALFDVRLFKNNSGADIADNWEVAVEKHQNGFASLTESRPDGGCEQMQHKLDQEETGIEGWPAWPTKNSIIDSWHDRVYSWTSTQLGQINEGSNRPSRPSFASSTTWRGSRGRGRGFAVRGFAVRGRRGRSACSKADLW